MEPFSTGLRVKHGDLDLVVAGEQERLLTLLPRPASRVSLKPGCSDADPLREFVERWKLFVFREDSARSRGHG